MKLNQKIDRIRLLAIVFISLFVISTGSLFATQSFKTGEIFSGILGIILALIILIFAIIVYRRGNKDLKSGLPIQDERSQKVMQKATSMAFLVSLYMLLAVGFLSDKIIKFRDVSQATSISVGIMALLFLIFWIYYNQKEL
jgi:uncharacterized membrane protein